MDQLWKIKVDMLQSGEHQRISIDDFAKQLGCSQKDMYRALDLFEQICDEKGRLRLEKIAEAVGWNPGKNLTMARIMDSFDEDRNGYVDYVEFLVLTKMFHGHWSALDKARFWWWVALYTDQESVMGGEKEVKTVERYKAEEMMKGQARGRDRDGVQRVPTQSLARFLRDALMSAGQLREGHRSKFQGTEFIANPAPSKVLNKVRAAMRDAGLNSEHMVFHQFYDVTHKGHAHFGAVLDAMHSTLQRFLLSGSSPAFPGELHLMKLRAFFYGRVADFLELDEDFDAAQHQHVRSVKAEHHDRWAHEDFSTGLHASTRAPSSARGGGSSARGHGEGGEEGERRLKKAHTHHGGAGKETEKKKREGPPPASEAMVKHKSYRTLRAPSHHPSPPTNRFYDPDRARAAGADNHNRPRLKKGKTALQLELARLDR